jgi:hypothetical protein
MGNAGALRVRTPSLNSIAAQSISFCGMPETSVVAVPISSLSRYGKAVWF